MMKIIKQNYLRWLLNAAVLLLLWLGMHFFSSRQYEGLFTIFDVGFCSMLFYICMRPAILHPKQHKIAWILLGVPAGWLFCVMLYGVFKLIFDPYTLPNTPPLSGALKDIRTMFRFVTSISVILFFFLDRNEDSKQKNIALNKLRSVYFMVLASLAYAFPVYFYGLHGKEFDELAPLVLFPLYVICLFVWLYRGWGKKGCLLGLLLVPLIVVSLIANLIGIMFIFS
ncbi:MAG: hypothetical protein J6Y85_04855 [Alphaproteobacteria bacterium]|nr:hypothetical protein [Alphaproteobacteria bacterium]